MEDIILEFNADQYSVFKKLLSTFIGWADEYYSPEEAEHLRTAYECSISKIMEGDSMSGSIVILSENTYVNMYTAVNTIKTKIQRTDPHFMGSVAEENFRAMMNLLLEKRLLRK